MAACVIVCVLKLRWGLIVLGVVVSIIAYVGPMITGNYLTKILWSLAYAPVWVLQRGAAIATVYSRKLRFFPRSANYFGTSSLFSCSN